MDKEIVENQKKVTEEIYFKSWGSHSNKFTALYLMINLFTQAFTY